MNDKLYRRLLIAVIAVCLVLTLAHLIYAILAYQSSSIIQFIIKEWW